MTITRINEFKAAAGKAEELFNFLQSLNDFITASEGCLSFEVLKSTTDKDKFVVIEKWQSETHHQQSIANYPQEDMQNAMPLFAEPPKGHYYSA
ncbi:MAG: putative quinol monooxygenase [Thalassotalea sp.]